jgi:hypothetical protein
MCGRPGKEKRASQMGDEDRETEIERDRER